MLVGLLTPIAKHDASSHHCEKNIIKLSIIYIVSAGIMAITITALLFALQTISQAQAATEAIESLSKNLAQQRLIQVSQATYSEQRLNALWERLDTTSNRLDSRMSIWEARQRIQ